MRGWACPCWRPCCMCVVGSRRPGLATNRPVSADPQAQLDPFWTAGILALSPTRPEECMDTFPDLGSLSDQELKDLIATLTDEEMEISYKRRILHGKIDILRAELVNRLRKKHEGGEAVISGADVQQLTDILAGRVPSTENAE